MLGIPPILTNTFVGIRQVDRASVDAARGIGMTEFQVLRKVELPLAIPSIMQGVRGASVNIVATATIAPLVGVATLGEFILGENVYGANGVLAGAIVHRDDRADLRVRACRAAEAADPEGPEAAAGTLADPTTFTLVQEKRRHQVRFHMTRPLTALAMLVAALTLAVGISACGGSSDSTSSSTAEETTAEETTAPEETETSEGEEPAGEGEAITANPANGKVSLTIGSKNFPEQEILGEIYAQALTAAGYKVKSDLSLGSETVALKAVESGAISGYPEYASTALTSFFGLEPEEVPADADRSLGKGKRRIPEEGPRGLRTDPVRQRQRGRCVENDGGKVRPERRLRPQGRLGKTDPLRVARVP